MLAPVREAERIELQAYADTIAAAPDFVPARSKRTGSAVAIRVPGVPLVELNRIMGLSSTAELDELEPFFESDPVVVSLDPEAGLDAELRGRGYRACYAWQKFERGLEPYEARTELRIAEAAPGDYGPVIAAAFGAPPSFAPWLDALIARPGWHVFASYDEGRAVGGGALFAPGGTGWLGIAGTLPEARGRGSQGAIFAARIERARELGLALLVTETGVPRDGQPGPSYRNMLRVGFRETYVRPNYVRPAAGAAP
jgi:GNAT superfamily N-acetyltransferase